MCSNNFLTYRNNDYAKNYSVVLNISENLNLAHIGEQSLAIVHQSFSAVRF
jgi:hypothetical protein